ncbi:MAG TPA: lamin tail domain-containing protein [Candidatus Limnocylindria bacterium]|nr:lamin tail domain-containing protein [Candidatus Limnocylindria bacterium]
MRFPFFTLTGLACFLAVASARAQVIVSELMADNKHTLLDEDGQSSDWLEIYNTSSTNVNLAGWSLTVDSKHQAVWTFPSTNLVAKGFMVVFASSKNRAVPGRNLHTDFNLKASGSYLALLKPGGAAASEFAPYPAQYTDVSYGITQPIITNRVLDVGASGRVIIPPNAGLSASWNQLGFNDAAWPVATTGIGFEDSVAGFAVYNYVSTVGVCSLGAADSVIATPSQQASVTAQNSPVVNFVNTGDSAHYGSDLTFPGLVIGNDADNFALRAVATITIPSAGTWTFGVNSDDGFRLVIGGVTMAYPDPRGPSDTLQTFNFPAAGEYPLELVFYECGGGSGVELFAAKGSIDAWNPTDFRLVGDTANGGLQVRSQIASGGGGGGGSSSYRSLIATDLKSQMMGVNATAYLRVPFTVANPAGLTSLSLRMRYDDGFIAYLNGVEVARRNAPASPLWNSTATGTHSGVTALTVEEINISDHVADLRTGANLLAIQGLNRAATDSAFLVVPELVDYVVSSEATNYFSSPSPGRANASGFIAFVGDTKFSVNRGFFTNAFDLAITTDTAGTTIRYTTNGSVPTLANGLTYTVPLHIAATTVLRAAAFKDGYQPSNADTQTYIFLADVIRQSPTGAPPPGWPSSWGGNTRDYGMDPNVVNNAAYSGTIVNDLQTIPSFSIVTDLPNLFDPSFGIYANPSNDGIDWERPTSIELIYPDGTKGFHSDAGLRIRGGYSRSTGNPKHAFRFFFRSEYGNSSLKYPMFASQHGVEKFDGLDLRTFQNYSWSFEGDSRGVFIRDVFSRDTQIDMGQPGERGDYYHLYINGQYWGLYNTAERPEASYASSYFGGDKSQYDVIKVDPGAGYTIFATDGNMAAWTRLWQAAVAGFASDAAYQKVQGNNADGTRNPNYEVLLDVDNLIDYMLVIFYGGNLDAPISAFLGNSSPNNWFGFRNTNGQSGFRFIAHDSEHTLLNATENRVGPFVAGNPSTGGGLAKSNPQYIFQQLWSNTEFKMHLADRVQKHFFHNGALTPQAAIARFNKRKLQIDRAVVGESARWGDSKREPPLTRNVEWVNAVRTITNSIMPTRTATVLGQLKAKSLYPATAPADFAPFGGVVTNGYALTITAPAGTIYYTRDGSDPRLPGGAVSPSALTYSAPVILTQGTVIKTRALNGTVWSALNEATFYIQQDFGNLLLTELMYHPPDSAEFPGTAYEFLELKNAGSTDLDLSGVQFTNGVLYTFPTGATLPAGRFAVLASNPEALAKKYPGLSIAGAFTNNLANGSETLTLVAPGGGRIFSLAYDSKAPWPVAPDGSGYSLVPVNPNFSPNPDSAANWRASTLLGGSPGADDQAPLVPVVLINEALTHTDPPQLDSVELYNPGSTNVDVGNWYLTDDRTTPKKYRIPSPRTIVAGGYLVITEQDWNPTSGGTNSFRLNSHGEQIYLFSGGPDGGLTGYSDGFSFGAAQNGVSFGRYVNSVGEVQYPPQKANTLGATNAGPRVGPVVINEINYQPLADGVEFIELKSITNGAVPLFDPNFPTNRWRLNGVGFDFPPNTTLPAGGLLLVVAGDPAAFRTRYGVSAAVQILGPYTGALQDNGESLALQRPDQPDVDTNTGAIFIPYLNVDTVRYDNHAPWPVAAAGTGESLERINPRLYGDDPVNWHSSLGGPSPGLENAGNRPPVVKAGQDQSITATNFPVTLQLTGTVVDDGLPQPPSQTTISWTQVSGPGTVAFDRADQAATAAYFPGVGTYVLRLTGDDSDSVASSDVTITIGRASGPVTLFGFGSVWRYLDNGSNLGTNWITPGFDDTSWASGPAPLGYGDANGLPMATTVGFGPDPNNKYITTYFRREFITLDPSSITELTLYVQRDDAVLLYLNGHEIYRDNFPDGPVDYLTPALNSIGGADETAIGSRPVDPVFLVTGANVLTAEVHQNVGTSSDIVLDAELSGTGFPNNQPPTVNAGNDQTVTLPAQVNLSAHVSDDGLPIVPGMLTFTWTKAAGPGAVTFADIHALKTSATFGAAGNYALRVTVTDGFSSVSDDVTVVVRPSEVSPIVLGSPAWVAGASPAFRFTFTAAAGQTYTVQYRDSLTAGGWLKLKDASGGASGQSVEILDPAVPAVNGRWYRVVSPQVP